MGETEAADVPAGLGVGASVTAGLGVDVGTTVGFGEDVAAGEAPSGVVTVIGQVRVPCLPTAFVNTAPTFQPSRDSGTPVSVRTSVPSPETPNPGNLLDASDI